MENQPCLGEQPIIGEKSVFKYNSADTQSRLLL